MKKVSLESYAKVNLTLQIKNKRSDGYHNISTIFQEIDLNDKIIMEKKSIKIENQVLSEENQLSWDQVQENLKNTLGLQIYTSW